MKKVSLKNEIGGILDNLQEVERPARYDGDPKEYMYQEGSFKCYVGTDVLTLEDAKTLLAQNVGRLARANTTPRSVIERRSGNFQKAMAFIGEYRELIPFLEYVSKRADKDKAAKEYIRTSRDIPAVVLEYTQRSPRLTWWKKNNNDFPPLSCLLDELPRIPMAWRA